MNVELANAVRLRRVVLFVLRVAILVSVVVGVFSVCTRLPELQHHYDQARAGTRPVPWLSEYFNYSATLIGLAVFLAFTQRWLVSWLVPLPRPACPACGYTLIPGTRHERCPECGLQTSGPSAPATPSHPAPPQPRS